MESSINSRDERYKESKIESIKITEYILYLRETQIIYNCIW